MIPDQLDRQDLRVQLDLKGQLDLPDLQDLRMIPDRLDQRDLPDLQDLLVLLVGLLNLLLTQ